jgi:hypothetical protein
VGGAAEAQSIDRRVAQGRSVSVAGASQVA